MGDVEEAIPLAAATADEHRSCCCSGTAHRRRPSPEDDDQLVKKSKKQLFPEDSTSPLSPASISRPSPSPLFPASALRRTISDPLAYSQLIKKLRDRVNELSDCLNQKPLSEIVSQEEQPQAISETDAPAALVTDQQDGEDSEGNKSDESVRVEKKGDSLNIHFRCPCGQSYHFMLSQGSCFYKVI